jgi:hypothetical protein
MELHHPLAWLAGWTCFRAYPPLCNMAAPWADWLICRGWLTLGDNRLPEREVHGLEGVHTVHPVLVLQSTQHKNRKSEDL